MVLESIRRAGPIGMTCDEVEQKLGLSHQTCSARVNELDNIGFIKILGKRPTRSGRNARVYHVVHAIDCDLDGDCSCV